MVWATLKWALSICLHVTKLGGALRAPMLLMINMKTLESTSLSLHSVLFQTGPGYMCDEVHIRSISSSFYPKWEKGDIYKRETTSFRGWCPPYLPVDTRICGEKLPRYVLVPIGLWVSLCERKYQKKQQDLFKKFLPLFWLDDNSLL